MIYKLLNKLFGWDYVQPYYSFNCGVARVQVDGMNRVWYLRVYESDGFGTKKKVAEWIEKPEHVIWLTCSPNKYFPPSLPKSANIDTMGAMKRAYDFIHSITDALGPYKGINGTQLVADAYEEGRDLREVIEQLEKINRGR